jgi:Mn2+/Fe2+ NRAMP family transporter
MLLLARDERLMGRYRNGPVLGAIAWGTTVVLVLLTVAMIWFTLRDAFA